MDGFFLIDKETGMTSHDVIAKLRKKLQIDKMGHTGTLDPLASGLLIVCSGKATKLAYLFENHDKVYQGVIQFGAHYDTYDTTGRVMKTSQEMLNNDGVKQKIHDFPKTYQQTPPMYSAIKQDGRKLYELARKGVDIERKTREVIIHSFCPISELIDQSIAFEAHVSKGTYIRSLVVDLADNLNTYGALSQLRRMAIGSYHVNQAKKVYEVESQDLIPLASFFADFPQIVLNDYMVRLVKNGVYLDERQTDISTPFIVTDVMGNYIAYYEQTEDHRYKPMFIF
jgi:tRNA pseudouridine55 synthase